jgi:hypothetical protein
MDDPRIEQAVPPSSLSLLGIVRHMAGVERNWFRPVLAGEEMRLIYAPDMDWEGASRGAATGDVSEAFSPWRAECDHARALVATARPGRPGGFPWPRLVLAPLVLNHMLEEYARHNGHADLLRECLDGVTGE